MPSIARQTKDSSYRELIEKINVLRTEKGYPLIPEDILVRGTTHKHPVLIPVLECEGPGTRRWWEYDEKMSIYREGLRLMTIEVKVMDMITKGHVPSMSKEEDEQLQKDLEAMNEGRAASFGDMHNQPQLDITKSLLQHFQDLDNEYEEEEEEKEEEDPGVVQERFREFDENWDRLVAENLNGISHENEEAPDTSEREANATVTGQNTTQDVIEISSNEDSPRATLGSFDSLMGTTTDSETANSRRRTRAAVRMREIQGEGRALDLTSDNNTDPRRRKLSQARNLQEEGFTSEPMRIDVSTENLSPRKALTLEMKQNSKFCTDVSDFLTKLEVCLQCPLSHQRYVNPVIGSDGNTYEEEFITHWLSRNSVCPLNRRHMY